MQDALHSISHPSHVGSYGEDVTLRPCAIRAQTTRVGIVPVVCSDSNSVELVVLDMESQHLEETTITTYPDQAIWYLYLCSMKPYIKSYMTTCMTSKKGHALERELNQGSIIAEIQLFLDNCIGQTTAGLVK